MTIHDGFRFGVGLTLGFMIVRLIPAVLIAALNMLLHRLRQSQIRNERQLMRLKEFAAILARLIARDED